MRIVSICVALAACGTQAKPDPAGTASGAPHVQSTGSAAVADPCAPAALGLPNTQRLSPLALTGDCPFVGTQVIKSENEARERFACAVGKVDWSKHSLLVTRRVVSPATVGFDALDDGAKVTFVGRQRSPCPDDPRPMPMEQTLAYPIPVGGDRAVAETVCTVPTKCP